MLKSTSTTANSSYSLSCTRVPRPQMTQRCRCCFIRWVMSRRILMTKIKTSHWLAVLKDQRSAWLTTWWHSPANWHVKSSMIRCSLTLAKRTKNSSTSSITRCHWTMVMLTMMNLSQSSSEKRFLAAKKQYSQWITRHLPKECQRMRICLWRVDLFDMNTSTTSYPRSSPRTMNTHRQLSLLVLIQTAKVGCPKPTLSLVQNWSVILLRRVRGKA